jgi:flagellar basal-body rod protein FlgF
MVYGIYSSAAGLMTSQYRQDVLANNLANVATVGFKQDLAAIRERLPASREELTDRHASDESLAGMTGGSLVAPSYTSFEPGAIETTGNPLDVAIAGEGFFRVRAGSTEGFTRDGRFTLNADGTLMTVTGHAEVLDEGGRPIQVPAALQDRVRIDANGQVRAGGKTCGQIGVVEFEDPSLLAKTGGNLLKSLGGKAVDVDATLQIGAVEASNVDPTRTMVSMIEASRAYQMNATMIGLSDQTLGRAVNELAKVK